jgi:LysM repeat protein
MKQTRLWPVTLVVGMAVVGVAPAAVRGAAERPGFETYVVRRGDTLSAISGRVFGDPKRWREILKENPQVTDANRIYPGDALLVPVPEAAVAAPVPEQEAPGAPAGAGTVAPAAVAPAEGAEKPATGMELPELPVETVRSVSVVNPALYRSAGYIADGLPAIAIVASEDDRELLATDDAAIINAPVTPGRRFTVVRVERRIFHPQTGRNLGWLTRVLGTAEVTCRDVLTSTIVFRGMRDAAGIGDYLVTIDPDDVLEENLLPGRMKPECVSAGPADGVIVAFDDDRLAVGEQDLVYLDRGTAASAVPGKRYVIYRETDCECRSAVGELQVLRAREQTATALVTSSLVEVQVGDLLRAR